MQVTCLRCQKVITEPSHNKEPRKFCSLACAWEDKVGKKRPEEVGRKVSLAKKGQKPSPLTIKNSVAARLGKKLSPEHRAKLGRLGHPVSNETRKKIGDALRGEKASNWRGGIYPEHRAIRKSAKYKEWREGIFKRDDYTCQHCGIRGGVELNVDHKFPFMYHKDLRFDNRNGQTLCVPCHRQTPTYGISALDFLQYPEEVCEVFLLA